MNKLAKGRSILIFCMLLILFAMQADAAYAGEIERTISASCEMNEITSNDVNVHVQSSSYAEYVLEKDDEAIEIGAVPDGGLDLLLTEEGFYFLHVIDKGSEDAFSFTIDKAEPEFYVDNSYAAEPISFAENAGIESGEYEYCEVEVPAEYLSDEEDNSSFPRSILFLGAGLLLACTRMIAFFL